MEDMENSSNSANNSQQFSSKKGGLRTMPFIIANEAFQKVASIGLQVNMILYLKNEYHLDNATGASILLMWGAVSNFMPSLGAILSDGYLGRFRVIAYGSVVTLLGLILLWLTALIDTARPPHCNITYQQHCLKPTPPQLALLFSSFALMSIGAGGILPCSLAFGADQFDNNQENPKNQRVLQTYFSWYYASVGVSIMISATVIVKIQSTAGWIVGYGVSVGVMLLATMMFLLGSKLYIKVKANKKLMRGLVRVIVMSWKNKHLTLPANDNDGWYYHDKNDKIVSPTERLRFLNKACMKPDGSSSEPWNNPCTAQQVEELKSVIKVLPLWSTSIIVSLTINHQTFPVIQATTMDRRLIGSFKIPPGSFGVFGIITLTIWVAIYDRIIVPMISKISKNPRGLTLQQRMGIGLIISCLATAVSALVERARRATAISEGLTEQPFAVVNMSAMWLVPQFCLGGLAEAFSAIAQIEFYYSQFPKSMATIAVSLFGLGMAVGNLVGLLVVEVVRHVSGKGDRISWLSDNLNKGHYDYYYWVLFILSVVNFFYYILCSWGYGYCEDQKVWDERKGFEEEDNVMYKESVAMETVVGDDARIVNRSGV